MSNRPSCSTVAIGSSAGGIKALQALFEALPADLGVAFVVISHLDPSHPSELVSILARYTTMPVREVDRKLALEPNRVYVIAPDRRLVIADNEIATLPFDEPRGKRAPVDLFFRSLAEQHGDGFAIVLSGGGSDGSIGIRAMKEAGGVILVQDPGEAEHASMPRNAIATGCADFVLPVAELAARLIELVGNRSRLGQRELTDSGEDVVRRLLTYLRTRTGHDFSNYKRPTILRRLTRRMQLNRKEQMEDYFDYLRTNVEEVQALFADLLISVTTFFRDPDAFDALAKQVIPHLPQADDASRPFRVWVPGCATGEEAYSLAILMLEEAAKRDNRPEIQIFATDLDPGALATARAGLYPAAIETDVAEARLRRFFIREGDYYSIKRDVRDLVVFASHSLLKDPPFSRLDLVSCRNLLIYLERDVQNEVLATLHYALNPGGYLFLGSAETADGNPGLFRTIDRKNRIYQAIGQRSAHAPPVSRLPTVPAIPATRGQSQHVTPFGRGEAASHAKAIEEFAPPSVLVDAAQRVLHLSETAGRFLLNPGGPLSSSVMQLVRPELRADVARGLHLALDKGEASLSPAVPVQFNGTPKRVIVQTRPVRRDGTRIEALLLFIEGGAIETDTELTQVGSLSTAPDGEVASLRDELQLSREELGASRAEYEATNEELRAANEELQSLNEEYRSTAEELETSKEELQSMNEELQTLNAELKTKVETVSNANSDLLNLMAAMEGGTLFLDKELRIKRFTPRITTHFNIAAGDAGRPITDFTHKLKYDRLAADARTVLVDMLPIEREVENADREWLLIRIRPYLTTDDRIDGVVITLIDVTKLRRAEEALRDNQTKLTAIVDTAVESIVTINEQGIIQSVNPATTSIFNYAPDELLGKNIKILMPESYAQAHDSYLDTYKRTGVAKIIGVGREVEGRRKDGTVVPIDLSVAEWSDGQRYFTGIMRDVTGRKEVERQLSRARSMEAVGQLAGGIAHDFNNLLAVVTGNLELAEAKVTTDDARQPLRRAMEAIEAGASLNRRLLSFAGRRKLAPERVVLNERIENLQPMLRSLLGEQIELELHPATDLWLTLADPGEIDSVVVNLASNARDAMPSGGKLSITTANVVLDAAKASAAQAPPGDYVCLEVADTGLGVPPELLHKVMEPFFTTKEPGKGTGLGLSSVYGFARQSGGFVEISSEVGHGTMLRVSLPRSAEAASTGAAGKSDAMAPMGNAELILVVEDNDQVREVTLARLEALGYTVLEARNGPEAIEMLKSEGGIELVLSDVRMPGGMSGYDIAKWVQAQRPDVKVVLASGDNHVGVGQTADTALRVLHKPYTRVVLARTVRELLDL